MSRFARSELKRLAGDATFARGEAYLREGRVGLLSDDGIVVSARVAGTTVYRTVLRAGRAGIEGECACPAFADYGFCKHLVATGLATGAGGDVPDRLGAIRAHLRGQGVERLAEMILDLAERDAALLDRLDLAARAAAGDAAGLAQRCRAALKRALRTGRFVEYQEAGSWVAGVLDVLEGFEGLLSAAHAALVLELTTDLFGRLPGALETVDDSERGGVEIAERAAALHLAACEALRPDPVTLARDLFRLETGEPFGTFRAASGTYGHLLGPAGLAEYRRLAEVAWDALPKTRARRGGVLAGDEEGFARYTLFPILDGFAARDGDMDRRIALRAAGLSQAHDYLRLAEFCLEGEREAEAVRWAEEGAFLFDDPSNEPLLVFLAERHRAAGRGAEAKAVLWRGFERQPSMRLYEALAKGTRARSAARTAMTGRALGVLEARLAKRAPRTGWEDVGAAGLIIEILLRERRLDAAWDAARRHGCHDGLWRQLAEASEVARPADAIAVYQRLAEAQVGLTNKHGYADACRLVGRIAAVRARIGEDGAQRAYVEDLLARHRAKRNFVAMLRETVSGAESRKSARST
ncbi:SWIM zinc finger family protein [Falsiroseomonas sp. HC035]|uniref:SWIM zinc finger family protein n=1 Tax=Falsiroseomonas sp. HC035 TaxID=3390999 RepID=UPI003D320B91